MKHGGFTLAEVLITLSIIGVVAALTIPSLVVNNQEKQTVVQLKKAYNVLSNAISLTESQYGPIADWGWGDTKTPNAMRNGAHGVMDKIQNNLNIVKRCDNVGEGCFPKGLAYKQIDGSNSTIMDNLNVNSSAILADSVIFTINPGIDGCTYNNGIGINDVCSNIDVDVNGPKGPNQFGRDTFRFYTSRHGLIPTGLPNDKNLPLTKCRTNGLACTAWAVLKENMDYPATGTGWD